MTTSTDIATADSRVPARRGALIDERITVRSDGVDLAVRLRGRAGASPLLVLAPGPGLALLPEARRIERLLDLHETWLTAYVDPRGCGASRVGDGDPLDVEASVRDVGVLAAWLAARAGAPVIALGMSFGASFSILAAARAPAPFRALLALGPDVEIVQAGVATLAFLEHEAAHSPRAQHAIAGIGAEVRTAKVFQRRAEWLTKLGGMQRDLGWGTLLRRTLVGLVGTYGPLGAMRALRGMTRVQDRMLPELATFSLAGVTRLDVPLTIVNGDRDVIAPLALARAWLDTVEAPAKQLVIVPGGRHVPHEEAPELVRAALHDLR